MHVRSAPLRSHASPTSRDVEWGGTSQQDVGVWTAPPNSTTQNSTTVNLFLWYKLPPSSCSPRAANFDLTCPDGARCNDGVVALSMAAAFSSTAEATRPGTTRGVCSAANAIEDSAGSGEGHYAQATPRGYVASMAEATTSHGTTRARAFSAASSIDGSASSTDSAEDQPRGCLAECRLHFCGCPTRQQLTGSLAFVLTFGALVVLSATGDLRSAMDRLETLNLWADVLLILLFIYTGMPFGYGYTIVAICTGYVSGWRGILTGWIGVASSVAVGVFVSRRCMRQSVQQKLDSLPDTWSRPVRLLSADLSHRATGLIFVDVLLRNSGFIPFGWVGAFVGVATTVPIRLAVFSAMLACMHGIVLNVSIGRALYMSTHNGNGTSTDDDDDGEGDSGAPVNLIIQIIISLSFGLLVSRYAKKQLARLASEELSERVSSPDTRRRESNDRDAFGRPLAKRPLVGARLVRWLLPSRRRSNAAVAPSGVAPQHYALTRIMEGNRRPQPEDAVSSSASSTPSTASTATTDSTELDSGRSTPSTSVENGWVLHKCTAADRNPSPLREG